MRTRDPLGRFKKGHRKLGGRGIGTPNRATQDMREAVILAASGDKDELVEYFRKMARDRPRSFAKMFGKLLPQRPIQSDPGEF